MARIIALWSAPRCRSTAFLRMMRQRRDCLVIREPFSHVADFGEARFGLKLSRTGRIAEGEQRVPRYWGRSCIHR
ncbi:hypothetical protein [Nonomuraea sediminis]|uniref:hypothetical protein n=1 Tax=Nonomuraea sediminis TaxID=2835864 RepID=UPI001BDDC43A|nr:hypothetical protein [Nonomuraea sediminis]